jgi:citrate lyase beta subunit
MKKTNLKASKSKIPGALPPLALPDKVTRSLLTALKRSNAGARSLPTLARQPVHVVYGGAHLFNADTPAKLGKLARKTLLENAPTPEDFDRGLELTLTNGIYERVLQKLDHEPIEDIRIDFEDGYGQRTDDEEDRDALRTARELVQAMHRQALPPFSGIRVKSLSDATAARALRTLDLFLSTFVQYGGPRLPEGFVITLPKVTGAEQTEIFARALSQLEAKLRLAPRSLRFEVMVEMPELLMNREGGCELPRLIGAAQGRLTAAHFGVYDFLSGCNVAAVDQKLTHPACDQARQLMLLAFAGTDVRLSDGATHFLPIGPHRAGPNETLRIPELEQNRAAVFAAWKQNYRQIRHSLKNGFYQGWDLHPAQIPIRYAAVFSFFAENVALSARRLKSFLENAARASLVGSHFDDEASGQGLLAFFIRGYACGAIDEEGLARAGLTPRQLKYRSFRDLLASR